MSLLTLSRTKIGVIVSVRCVILFSAFVFEPPSFHKRKTAIAYRYIDVFEASKVPVW